MSNAVEEVKGIVGQVEAIPAPPANGDNNNDSNANEKLSTNLEWKEISTEVVAEMVDTHQKNNIHYSEDLEAIETKIEGGDEEIGDSVQQAFQKIQNKPVIRNMGKKPQVIKKDPTENLRNSNTRRDKKTEAASENEQEEKTDEIPKPYQKVIDFSVLNRKPAVDAHRKRGVEQSKANNDAVITEKDTMKQLLQLMKKLLEKETVKVVHNHFYSASSPDLNQGSI